MKKRNLILGFLFAILSSLIICFSPNAKAQTYAAGAVTISFDSNQGICDVSELQTNDDGTLPQIPSATKKGWFFIGWEQNGELIDENTAFTQDTTLVAAYSLKTYNYTISESSGSYSAVAQTHSTEHSYTLGSPTTDLNELISQIKSDADASKTTTLNLNKLTLTEDLNLDIPLLAINGSLNLQSFSINYSIPSNNSVLTLNDLTINSNSNNNLININGDSKLSIYLSNCKFNNANGTDNYTFFIDNSSTSINATNKISYESRYFYNHNTGTVATMNSVDPSEQASGKYSITIPYYEDGALVVTSNISPAYFEFVNIQDNYSCEVYQNSSSLMASITFSIEFDTNGGTMDDSLLSTTSSFQRYSNINYPSESELTKDHCTLNGFAGTFTLSPEQMTQFQTTTAKWFFDKISIESYLINTDTSKTFLDFCYDELPTADNNGFTFYNYDSNYQEPNFLAIVLMLDLNLTPKFTALWSETIYYVYFETNGGESVDQTAFQGIFGTTLPALPTISMKGHTFAGWYASEDFDDSSLKTNNNFQTMPDTNPTLYAKWQVNTYTLTIYSNDDNSKIITRDLNYNTPLSTTITPEISSEFSKIGYTFAGWYNKPLSDADAQIVDTSTYLMPDNNISIYADWTKNQYTLTLKNNHPKNTEDYQSITDEYETDISYLQTSNPTFDGYEFRGWLTESKTRYADNYPYLPDSMPAENVTLYAQWRALEYKIIYHLNEHSTYETQTYHYEDVISFPNPPIVSGFVFSGWYTTPQLTESFSMRTMPLQDIHLYAKMTNKRTLIFNTDPQSYTVSNNNGFKLNISINNVTIEYLVNDKWQTEVPKSVGVYDVRITRYEDSQYNAINTVIKKGLEITLNPVSLSVYSLVLYFIAGIELVLSIIVMLMRKQRQTYLTYAIALPFGLVSNSDFTNFIISLTLALFGFVMLIIQYTKLRKVNIEISKISDETKEYTPPDVSTNKTISQNVDILLEKEGFFSSNKNESSNQNNKAGQNNNNNDDLNLDKLEDDDDLHLDSLDDDNDDLHLDNLDDDSHLDNLDDNDDDDLRLD